MYHENPFLNGFMKCKVSSHFTTAAKEATFWGLRAQSKPPRQAVVGQLVGVTGRGGRRRF